MTTVEGFMTMYGGTRIPENGYLLEVPHRRKPTLTPVYRGDELPMIDLQELYFWTYLTEAEIETYMYPKWMHQDISVNALLDELRERLEAEKIRNYSNEEAHYYWQKKLQPLNLDKISDFTGFDKGELFSSPEEVERYFADFGTCPPEDGEPKIPQLTFQWMAETVIENKWHCEFRGEKS